MSGKWTELKKIIGTKQQPNLFLTLMNAEGAIICANANMKRTLHLGSHESKGVSFFDFLHPAHFSSFKEAIRQSAENGHPAGMELYLKNGNYHPTKWEIFYLQDNHRSASYLAIGHMLLDKKTTELRDNSNKVTDLSSKLEEKETLFNQFMNYTPDFYWVVDENSCLVFANPSFTSSFLLRLNFQLERTWNIYYLLLHSGHYLQNTRPFWKKMNQLNMLKKPNGPMGRGIFSVSVCFL